jgi:hypothetical protein
VKYAKNISYSFNGDPREYEIAKRLAGGPGQVVWLMHSVHQKHGMQMQVSKQVSDDLAVTDFHAGTLIENIPMPAKCVEIFFDDPQIPTILMLRCTKDDISVWFPWMEAAWSDGEHLFAIIQEGTPPNGKHHTVHLVGGQLQRFIDGEFNDAMNTGILSAYLSKGDDEEMGKMIKLALKVFIFSSIPQFKPSPITRKMMKAGKPGVCNRPNRPSVRVQYLPHVYYDGESKAGSGSKAFHGRRGHVRWFSSEYFVNKKGSWSYVRPVADPATGRFPERSIARVRKP